MNTKTKRLVPNLRFEEFTKEWEVHEIGEFIKDRKVIATSDIPLYSLTIEYGVIPKSKRYERSFLVKGEESAYKMMLPNDFAFNPMNLRFGALAKYKGQRNVAVSKYYDIFYCSDICNSDYIEYFLTTNKMIQFYNKMSTGTLEEKKRVHYLDFIHFKKPFPSLPEQQKIAAFLTSIDSKLQQLNTKKTLLEQYKKGAMQQLFSQKLRFKDDDGKDYADWEEKQYGQIFSFYSTNSLSRDKLNYEIGKVKNIHYGDIHTKFSMLFDIKDESVPFINQEIDLSKIKEENYCQEGDLVIADASEDYNDIGKTIELVNLNNEKVLAGLHTFLARPDKYKMQSGFSGYLIQTWKIRKQVMTIAQGTKVLSLATSRLGKIKLMIPELAEQQKIANYLSAIDIKIETITQQIDKTQGFKKGLLQGMFV